jgi:hypothetical protein
MSAGQRDTQPPASHDFNSTSIVITSTAQSSCSATICWLLQALEISQQLRFAEAPLKAIRKHTIIMSHIQVALAQPPD